MADDRHPIGRRMHVCLEVSGTDRKRRKEGEEGIFRRIRRQAAVSEDAGQRASEEPIAGAGRAWFGHPIFRLASVVLSRALGRHAHWSTRFAAAHRADPHSRRSPGCINRPCQPTDFPVGQEPKRRAGWVRAGWELAELGECWQRGLACFRRGLHRSRP